MVTIVGAGPAGATAARALARAGVPVRLLDRSVFPRNKPCGGGISMRVLGRFPYLEPALSRISTHSVSRLHLEGPDGLSVEISADAPAVLLIRRVEFDSLLVDLAIEAGAQLVTGADVTQASIGADDRVTLATRDGRSFEASTVIAADGVHSVVGRRLGLNPGWPARSVALDMMEETPRTDLRDIDPSRLWVSYGFDPTSVIGRGDNSTGYDRRRGAAHEGYAYIFPKKDHVNIGLGYVLDHYRRYVRMSPYTLQRAFVERLRGQGVVEGESSQEYFTPFIIPVGGPLRRPGRGRVLLAGDAGGFVNGLTAEGIYYAMVSGELAARAVIETNRTALGPLVARYARAVNREIGAELRDAVILQRLLFADGKRIAQLIEGARQDQVMIRIALELFLGRAIYHVVRRRLLARAPRLAARLLWERTIDGVGLR